MVQACCNLCGHHYVNEDKTIDKEYLQKIVGPDVQIVVEDDSSDPLLDIIKKHGQRTPKLTYLVQDNIKHKLCICECHVKGTCICH